MWNWSKCNKSIRKGRYEWPSLAFAEKSVYIRGMFFNRYITLPLPHFGLLLAGLLRPAR